MKKRKIVEKYHVMNETPSFGTLPSKCDQATNFPKLFPFEIYHKKSVTKLKYRNE